MPDPQDEAAKLAEEWAGQGALEWDGASEVQSLMRSFLRRFLASRLRPLLEERDKLKAAIKEHHDQHADDRCYLDDQALYAAAGLEPADITMPPRGKFLENCARFYERRCTGGDWPSYQYLESQVTSLRQRLAEAEAEQQRLRHGRDLAVSARDLAQRTLKAAENIINTYPEYEGKLPHDAFFIAIQRLEEATQRAEQAGRVIPAAIIHALRLVGMPEKVRGPEAVGEWIRELGQRAERAEQDAMMWKDQAAQEASRGASLQRELSQAYSDKNQALGLCETLQREREEAQRHLDDANTDVEHLMQVVSSERAARQEAEEAIRVALVQLEQIDEAISTAIIDEHARGQVIGDFHSKMDHLIGRLDEIESALEAALTEEPGRGKPQGLDGMDLLELAWGVIANAGGGNWTLETQDWQTAAAAWRDRYFGSIQVADPPPAEEGKP